MTHILHFTISPVQSFIGQSRRTRDLWSSSFLLSWLSGIAMAKVIASGGKIVFPAVQGGATGITDDMLRAILGKPENVASDRTPFIGTLPNRFKAEVPENFNPADCAAAVQAKWEDLAKQIRNHFLPLEKLRNEDVLHIPAKARKNPNSANKSLTETLWDQQVNHFWDIQWVKGVDRGDGSDARWLDLRKNWRQHVQPDQQEPGDACTLMPGWVELSGHVRSLHKEKQDVFWEIIRGHLPGVHHGENPGGGHGAQQVPDNPGVGALNLRDDERLCAIAFVKRLWPKLPRESIKSVIGWVPDDKTKSAGNWPSTAYMAALPWVEATFNSPYAEQTARCDAYVKALQSALVQAGDRKAGLFSETLNGMAGIKNEEYFCTLDGQLFFEDGLQAAAKEGLLRQEQIGPLQKLLKEIAPKTKASPFYAVLRMDGDSVGKLIADADNATKVSAALAAFASQVRGIVDDVHHGATLYAGGDDVLALLPLNSAIACAKAIQQAYQAAMQAEKLVGTISAAIVFAHYHLPLSFVMAESGRLLDDVAKTQNGRNSLAVAVHKPGGLHLEWASRWDDAVAPVPEAEEVAEAAVVVSAPAGPVQTLLDLVTQFNPKSTGAATGLPLSSGFLYRIRERWGDLATRNSQGQAELQFSQMHVQQLWAADLLANRDLGQITDDSRVKAMKLAEQLFTVSRNNPNHAAPPSPPPDPSVVQPNLLFSESGGLLARFLATKGVAV